MRKIKKEPRKQHWRRGFWPEVMVNDTGAVFGLFSWVFWVPVNKDAVCSDGPGTSPPFLHHTIGGDEKRSTSSR